MAHLHTFSFSVNNWNHLYSLQQAIQHNRQYSGRSLSISGRLLKQAFLSQRDTDIHICFLQQESPPDYPEIDKDTCLLGQLQFSQQKLSCEIPVDARVFEELRKNLTEYADIEGIHIVVSLGVISESEHWQEQESLQIVQLDYAMKGDA